MRYANFEPIVAQARPRAELWRLILGVVAIVAIYIALGRLEFAAIDWGLGLGRSRFYDELEHGRSPLAMYVLLFGFGLLVVAVICAVGIVHRRGVGSLIGPWRQTGRQFWRVCAGLACLYGGLIVLPPWDLGGPLVSNLPLGLWFTLLPFSLLAVLVQVTGEEVLFRGYLQQQLAARFQSPWVFLLVPSLLFGAGHYVPMEAGDNAWIIALWAVMFGVLMADITARAGTLGPAIALHFANNIVAMLIISVPDSLSGLALYVTPFPMADVDAMRAWLPVDFALMWISWLVARIAIRR